MAADKAADLQTTALVKADIDPDNPDAGLTNQEIKELYNELVSLGLESTSTREGRVTRTTFREEGIELVFEKKTGRNRISFGDDAWGFYIKIEWWEQLAVSVAAGSKVSAGIKAGIKAGLIALKSGTAGVVLRSLWSFLKDKAPRVKKALERIGALLFDGVADGPFQIALAVLLFPCSHFQPYYIRLDPIRGKCG